MYSYIEMYDGTPELHPVTGPDNDAARAGDCTNARQAIAANDRTPGSSQRAEV
jgi:hypothetical protein